MKAVHQLPRSWQRSMLPIMFTLILLLDPHGSGSLLQVQAKKDRKTPVPTEVPSQPPSQSPRPSTTIPTTSAPSTLPSPAPTTKPTLNPTGEPSFAPTTPMPSAQPSSSPSRSPTPNPTEMPSVAPTMTPSKTPSTTPTSQPTFLPVPGATNRPTDVPSHSPTRAPTTDAPTGSTPTTDAPTIDDAENDNTEPTGEQVVLQAVTIPTMVFAFEAQSSVETSNSASTADDVVAQFIESILTTNAAISRNYQYSVLYVALEDNPDEELFQQLREGTRFLVRNLQQPDGNQMIQLNVNGTAHFQESDETTTEQDLKDTLNGYFSFWGKSDLRDHLEKNDIIPIGDIYVAIDGQEVETVRTDADAASSDDPDVSTARNGASANGDDGDNSSSALATTGIIAAAILVTLAMVLASVFVFIKSRSVQKNAESYAIAGAPTGETSSNGSGKSKGKRNVMMIEGHHLPPITPQDESPEHYEMSGSDRTPNDISLYTEDLRSVSEHNRSSSPSESPQPHEYDATRLDRVIALARQTSYEAPPRRNSPPS